MGGISVIRISRFVFFFLLKKKSPIFDFMLIWIKIDWS